jgi:hypothetical protein
VIQGCYDKKNLLRGFSDRDLKYKRCSDKIKDLRRDVMNPGRFEQSGKI